MANEECLIDVEQAKFVSSLEELKRCIPENFRPWRVDNKYNNYTGDRSLSINSTYYNPSDLGWIDEPMNCYRAYGVYSSKDKAIAAARLYQPTYRIYCEGRLL